MKKILWIAFISIAGILNAQVWTQRASLTGVARSNAVGFTIGSFGYIATGFDGTNWLNDLWAYDMSSNTWTQRAAMPVQGREGAVAWVIGTKAYICTGKRDTVFLNDLWEWDQATNTWLQRANFPGTPRSEAAGFSIGNRAFVGTGYSGVNCFDFYMWDQGTNTWQTRANFPVNARNSAIGFSLNSTGRGYIGSGYASGNVYQDIYEFNPSTNTWAFSGMTNYMAYAMAASVLQNYAFYGTGIDDNAVYYNNFSRYDPSNGSAGETPFGGTNRHSAIAFSGPSSIFMGTGMDGWYTQDLWECTPVLSFPDQVSQTVFPATLKVYDLNGRLRIDTMVHSADFSVPMRSLPCGVYLISVNGKSQKHLKLSYY